MEITSDDVHKAFASGEVYAASDEALLEYLRVLNTNYVPNEGVRHRELSRAFTINTLLTQRFIERTERSNTRLSWLVVALAILSLVASIVQVVAAF